MDSRFGIITVRLTDPLSIIIDQLLSIKEEEPNAVGFYFTINNSKNIALFNSYDGQLVKWISDQYTLTKIIASPFVTKIKCYPLIETSSLIINDNTLLEKRFIDIVQGLIIAAKFSISMSDFSFIFSARSDCLINKVLSYLTGEKPEHFTDCSLIKNYSSYNKKLLLNYNEEYITDICQNEIDKLKEYLLNHCDNRKMIDLSVFPSSKITSNHLINLHYYLSQIIKCNNRETQELAFKNIVALFNDIVTETDIPQITIPKEITSFLRPKIILSHQSLHELTDNILFNSTCDYQNNLTILSNEQLLDLLIYIDSLRDSTGLTDIRFAKLQNEITFELANR